MAEDITAETFLRFWQFLQTNQEVLHVRALLYQIARNLIVDAYRKRANEPGVRGSADVSESVTLSARDTSTSIQGESDQRRIEAQMQARAEVGLIFRDLERLKEEFQDVVVLRLVEELSFKDIAKVLNKTSGNVRVIYHRALKVLNETQKKIGEKE